MTSPERDRIEIITALRGVAALSVAWYHFSNSFGLLPDGLLKLSGLYGWLGVEIFFVISGFVIPYSMYVGHYDQKTDKLRFLAKRLIRLEPPYFCAIAIIIVLSILSSRVTGKDVAVGEITVSRVLLHIGYLNALVGQEWLNPMFWTLAVEFQYYLLMLLLFPFVGSTDARVRIATIVVLTALSLVFRWKSLVFPYLGLFSLGMLAFHARCGMLGWRGFAALSVPVAVATAFALDVPSASAGFVASILVGFATIPRIGLLVWLGEVSYSVYLLHGPIGGRVINLGARFADGMVSRVLILVAAFAVTLLASYMLYRLVERPAQRLAGRIRYGDPSSLKRLFGRGAPPAASAAREQPDLPPAA